MQSLKYKNHTGRKHISMKPTYKHRGEDIAVNAKGSGLYTRMLGKSFEQFDICLDKWKRQTFIMIELHQDFSTIDNKRITQFRKRLFYKIQQHYGKMDIGFHWVREQEKAKGQHYHFALWLDGDKVNKSHMVSKFAREVWENMGGFYSSNRKTYMFIDDQATRLEALHWLSYLSKGRGKGYRQAQTKDYRTSRFNASTLWY
jgi:hypothetical protein